MADIAKTGLISGRWQQRIPGQRFGLAWHPYDTERFEAIMKRSVAEINAQNVAAAQLDTAIPEALNIFGLGGHK